MKRRATVLILLFGGAVMAAPAHAFCGFYVASGDAKLFNHASQVVLVRDGDRTVMTMANDFKGEPKEFAIVVPVPTVLKRGQIHVGDKAVIDHLDAYSAPRLVEYTDASPCEPENEIALMESVTDGIHVRADRKVDVRMQTATVRIEARYTVDEYDILILSATESDGLERWLRAHGYRIPDGASAVLASYVKQGLKFFVAKVNLKEKARLGFNYLRPIQVAFESPKFVLPVRLGTVNADGPQELFAYVITRQGRAEAVNYRTVKLPTDQDVPEYVKDVFPDFYRAMFAQQTRQQNMGVVFTEYAWNSAGCDPCASEPLSVDEQKSLGVFWLDDPRGFGQSFVTRLHARYDSRHFPEDLVLQVTGDQQNWQSRFVLHHPWKGGAECEAAVAYYNDVRRQRAREVDNLATLTGWPASQIRARMNADAAWLPSPDAQPAAWWDKLWKK